MHRVEGATRLTIIGLVKVKFYCFKLSYFWALVTGGVFADCLKCEDWKVHLEMILQNILGKNV